MRVVLGLVGTLSGRFRQRLVCELSNQNAVRELQTGFDTVGQARGNVGANNDPVHDHINVVFVLLVELRRILLLARAVSLVIPELKGKMDGVAIRVPTPNVSLIDLAVEVETDCDATIVNKAFQEAAQGPLRNVLDYSEAPIVSSDLNGSPYSATLDSLLTTVMDKRLVKVFAWYDNEWGYSCRLRDLVKFLAQQA